MTSDEARDRFSEALDGELDAEARAAFEATLAADPELREEYALFRDAITGARELAHARSEEGDARPKILEGVQSRLRTRSRGRFYRDRWSTMPRAKRALPMVLAIATILLFLAAWAGFHVVELVEPGRMR